MKTESRDPEGWGCFLAAAMVGVVLLWIKDAITWPFRAIRRWFGE